MATVLVPLASGFEEIEAVTIIDILRRADINVVVAGLEEGPIRGSHHIVIDPDCALDAALGADYDMVVLPGGMPGAENLEKDQRVIGLLQAAAAGGKFTAAICAAPKVLAAAGLLEHRRATSYPGFLQPDRITGLRFTGVPVEQDDKVITSRGAGTAMDFALTLVENLSGRERRDAVETSLQRAH